MNDYDKLAQEMNEKVLMITKKHASIIEEKLKEAIVKYDCKPNQIHLSVHPEFKYEIYVKYDEFSTKDVFSVRVTDE